MATRAVTPTSIGTFESRHVVVHTWAALTAAGDVGANIEVPGYADKTVQISGNWGGSTVVLQGSNDGATWFTLTDPQGNAISASADKLEMVAENPRFIRPSMSGGTGASVIVTILSKAVK